MPDITELVTTYELANRAAGKSPKTIKWYSDLLKLFCRFLKDCRGHSDLSLFTIDNAREYIIHLKSRTKFDSHPLTPTRGAGLSNESIRGNVRAVKAFSTWLQTEGHTPKNILQGLKMPKAQQLYIKPLTEAEVNLMLNAINRQTLIGQRDYTILILLLDTGLRESEVAQAKIQNLNLRDGCLQVLGKGGKERVVPFGTFAQNIISGYVNHVRTKLKKGGSDNLFLSTDGRPVTNNTLKLLFSRLKKKTGISRVHAHLLRHTFAINYLFNGGDIFTLKEILGHTSLEMVNRYLHFTNAQISARHHEFSPMDRLNGGPKIKLSEPGQNLGKIHNMRGKSHG